MPELHVAAARAVAAASQRSPARITIKVLISYELLTSKVFGKPLEDGLVPKLAVLRLEHPMAFVGEVKESGWNPFALERREQAHALADRHAKI